MTKRQRRRSSTQASIGFVVIRAGDATHSHDNPEGCQVGEQIGKHVERHAGDAQPGGGCNSDEHIAGMANRGIRQQSLEVLLRQRQDIPDGHRDGCKDRQHDGPVDARAE